MGDLTRFVVSADEGYSVWVSIGRMKRSASVLRVPSDIPANGFLSRRIPEPHVPELGGAVLKETDFAFKHISSVNVSSEK